MILVLLWGRQDLIRLTGELLMRQSPVAAIPYYFEWITQILGFPF